VSSDPCRDTEAADKSALGKEVEGGEGGSLIGTTRNGLVAGGGSLSASHRSRRGRVIGRAVSVAGTERGDGAGMFYSNTVEKYSSNTKCSSIVTPLVKHRWYIALYRNKIMLSRRLDSLLMELRRPKRAEVEHGLTALSQAVDYNLLPSSVRRASAGSGGSKRARAGGTDDPESQVYPRHSLPTAKLQL